ncbi:RNA methyltransferase [bacterium]|nr:RNA methyltransferase [bacterium]
MKLIQSKDHQVLKRIKRLSGHRRTQDSNDLIIEGKKLLFEAIHAKIEIKVVCVEEGCEEDWMRFSDILYVVPPNLFSKISTLDSPSKVIGVGSIPSPKPLDELLHEVYTLVVLDRVQDPGNLGTLVRTSEAFIVDALICLKGSCSVMNPKVLRAAAGSAFRIPIYETIDEKAIFEKLKSNGFTCFAMGKSGLPIQNVVFPKKTAFFFGTEGEGLSETCLSLCQNTLTISMKASVESLNVATSVAITLHERSRREDWLLLSP